MSFLMVFKGELVTDTRWGLLYVIMGSNQGTLDPLSLTLCHSLLFEIWKRGWEGENAQNVHCGAGTGTQRTNGTGAGRAILANVQ